jgi:serine protease Do
MGKQAMTRTLQIVTMAVAVAAAPRGTEAAGPGVLRSVTEMSDSFRALVEQVAPSVVQVVVTAYAPVERNDSGETDLVLSRQRSIGSGVVVDASGYIMTNAHVVSGARRIRIVLPPQAGARTSQDGASARDLAATVVGTSSELDLALLKVDAAGLRPLPFGDSNGLRQGELVFAFGSPEGFRNSVSMGVVSATARQPDPDTPIAYIQTDAAINHGNSGGPLVNASGQLVGINTFIISSSGGSEGLGFALPSSLVQLAYPKLRTYGQLHRGEVGMLVQTITPELHAGLHLSESHGLVVADVTDGKPAALAGLHIGDIIDTLDGQPVDNVLAFAMRMFVSDGNERVRIGGMRGERRFVVSLSVLTHVQNLSRLTDFIEPDSGLVPNLGIIGVSLTPTVAELLPSLRADYGVVVAAHAAVPAALEATLTSGDVIHAVNGEPVSDVADLRAKLRRIPPDNPVVLQIERNGQFSFVVCDADN